MIILSEDKNIISLLPAEDAQMVMLAMFSKPDDMPDMSPIATMAYTVIKSKSDRILSRNEAKQARDSAEYKAWRYVVLRRVDYTCRHCFQHGGNLHVHHIERFKSNVALRLEPDNGITLCEKCHRILHKREGR